MPKRCTCKKYCVDKARVGQCISGSIALLTYKGASRLPKVACTARVADCERPEVFYDIAVLIAIGGGGTGAEAFSLQGGLYAEQFLGEKGVLVLRMLRMRGAQAVFEFSNTVREFVDFLVKILRACEHKTSRTSSR